jgi:hypothetical protein
MTRFDAHSVVFDWVPDGVPPVSQRRRNGVRVTTAAAAALGLALGGEDGARAGGTTSETSSNGFASTKAPRDRGRLPERTASVESVVTGGPTLVARDDSDQLDTVNVTSAAIGSFRPATGGRIRPSPRSRSRSLTPWGPDRALRGEAGGLHKRDHPRRLLSSD